MDRIGGYEALIERYPIAASSETFYREATFGNASCGFPPSDAFHIFRGMDSAYPWPGLTIGLTLLASYFFCTNQVRNQQSYGIYIHTKKKLFLKSLELKTLLILDYHITLHNSSGYRKQVLQY